MDTIKIKYSDLENMAKGAALEDSGLSTNMKLANVIDSLQSSLESTIDILDEQSGDSIKALKKNLNTMKDSLRGIENNAEDLVEDLDNFYENMSEVLLAKDDNLNIEVSDEISNLLKDIKDAKGDYNNILSNINFVVSGIGQNGHFFLKNAEEKKATIAKADTALTNSNANISQSLSGIQAKYESIIEDLKKLDDWIDTDTDMQHTKLAVGLVKVAIVGAISVALGPVGGFAFSAILAGHKAWRNGKSTTEAVVIGTIDAAAGEVIGDAVTAGKQGIKVAGKKMAGGVELVAKKAASGVEVAGKQISSTVEGALANASKNSRLSLVAFSLNHPSASPYLEEGIKKSNQALNSVKSKIPNVKPPKLDVNVSNIKDKGVSFVSDGYKAVNDKIENKIVSAHYDVHMMAKKGDLKLTEMSRPFLTNSDDFGQLATDELDNAINLKNDLIDNFVITGHDSIAHHLKFEENDDRFIEKVIVNVISDPIKGETYEFTGNKLFGIGEKVEELNNIVSQLQAT